VGECRTVDARHLPAPEPMERVVDALGSLAPDGRLRLLIHREPFPLYDILRSWGYSWQCQPQEDGSFVVLIWRGS
jgi:uncharacterized protein (DUF2249 family)